MITDNYRCLRRFAKLLSVTYHPFSGIIWASGIPIPTAALVSGIPWEWAGGCIFITAAREYLACGGFFMLYAG